MSTSFPYMVENGLQKNLQKIKLFISLLATFLIIARYIPFLNDYGGIEADSGWVLGISKNIAQKGIYASNVNAQTLPIKTIAPSIYGQPSIHDNEGYLHFYVDSVATGPGFILPQALMYKIFGEGWWQNRLWAMISFGIALVLSFYFTFLLGNYLSFFLLFIWIWGTPYFTIVTSFEAYPMATTVMYMLISLFLFFSYIKKLEKFECSNELKIKMWHYLLLCGFFAGMAFKTKALALIILGAYCAYYFSIMLKIIKNPFARFSFRQKICSFSTLCIGFIFPVLLYELYRAYYVIDKFGIDAYYQNNLMITQKLLERDSGVNFLYSFLNDLGFVYRKIIIWSDVGITSPVLFWLLMIVFSWLFFVRSNHFLSLAKRTIIALILVQISVHYIWFIFASPTGWMQHLWISVYLGMIYMCIVVSLIYVYFDRLIIERSDTLSSKITKRTIWASLFLMIVWGLSYDSIKFNFSPRITKGDLQRWNSNEFRSSRAFTKNEKIWSKLNGEPRSVIFELKYQKEVLDFFKKNIAPCDRIFTVNGFVVPEISLMTNKVFFPLSTFSWYLNEKNDKCSNGKFYLIMNSYIYGLSPWKVCFFSVDAYVDKIIKDYCSQIVFSNYQYMMCLMPRGIHG
ncbi:MAG: hypothetical protein HQK53_10355 [Oligoflexia bacterium]|nr:hypothetical protein [Oligoflexia bacterium]